MKEFLRSCLIEVARYGVDFLATFGFIDVTSFQREFHLKEFLVKTLTIFFALGFLSMIVCGIFGFL